MNLRIMPRELHDHFFREAKREGYRSRAAYKLIEIDDRRHLLKRGDAVLDCGAAPGSWLQVAAERVGPNGRVVGVDLKPIDPAGLPQQVRLIEGDFTTMEASELLGGIDAFGVVLSDMAPSTTGDRTIDHHGSVRLCHAVIDRCGELLQPGGMIALKVLEGEAYPDLIERARHFFGVVKGFKPKASRDQSTEIYLIADDFSGESTRPPAAAAPKPSPSGWGQ